MTYYILKGTEVHKAKSMEEWAEYMAVSCRRPTHRHVALEDFYLNDSLYCSLSTVFLGIDHNFNLENNTPILFESMIFSDNSLDQTMERYATWENAAKGHTFLCSRITSILISRHKAELRKSEEDDKHGKSYFVSKINGLIVFNDSDLRLIRED
jgi:hypothetical protein